MPLNLLRDPYIDSRHASIKGIPMGSLLAPATEDWDREERRALMFVIAMFDVWMSSSAGWPTLVPYDELVSLPSWCMSLKGETS